MARECEAEQKSIAEGASVWETLRAFLESILHEYHLGIRSKAYILDSLWRDNDVFFSTACKHMEVRISVHVTKTAIP
jgi:hypothetical protein